MRRKVLHITTSLNVGGAERALFTLLNNGLESKYENIVISLLGLGHYGPLLASQGITVYSLGMKKNIFGLGALIDLAKLVREIDPDIVQGWMYHGNFAALLAVKFYSKRSVLAWNVRITLESLQLWPILTRSLVYIQSLWSASPFAVIYNSERSKNEHIEFGYADYNSVVIPNGFNTEYWRPSETSRSKFRTELALNPHSILIGFVGRNHEEKNIAGLLQSLNGVLHSDSEVYAVLIGRGVSPQAENLLEYVARLPEGKIKFLGERVDIEKIMPSFDVLCLPSKGEGFPNVIGEAMACAVPCVATDVGDVLMIVGDTGWVVPSNDINSLRDAINDAISLDPGARMELGLRARSRIERMFSIESSVSKYISLYDGALVSK